MEMITTCVLATKTLSYCTTTTPTLGATSSPLVIATTYSDFVLTLIFGFLVFSAVYSFTTKNKYGN